MWGKKASIFPWAASYPECSKTPVAYGLLNWTVSLALVHLVLSGLLTATWCRCWELLHLLAEVLVLVGVVPRPTRAEPASQDCQTTARGPQHFNPITVAPGVLATPELWDKTGFDIHLSLPREGPSTVSFSSWVNIPRGWAIFLSTSKTSDFNSFLLTKASHLPLSF